MGRPRELTEEERQQLLADGYRPVEVWVPDLWSNEVWEQIEADCRAIRDTEDHADADLWIEASAREAMRLIDHLEEDGRVS